MAFMVINPNEKKTIYNFVLNQVNGEPRTAIMSGNSDNWLKFKEFLRNSYIERRHFISIQTSFSDCEKGRKERK
jgi:hypothetical protein